MHPNPWCRHPNVTGCLIEGRGTGSTFDAFLAVSFAQREHLGRLDDTVRFFTLALPMHWKAATWITNKWRPCGSPKRNSSPFQTATIHKEYAHLVELQCTHPFQCRIFKDRASQPPKRQSNPRLAPAVLLQALVRMPAQGVDMGRQVHDALSPEVFLQLLLGVHVQLLPSPIASQRRWFKEPKIRSPPPRFSRPSRMKHLFEGLNRLPSLAIHRQTQAGPHAKRGKTRKKTPRVEGLYQRKPPGNTVPLLGPVFSPI